MTFVWRNFRYGCSIGREFKKTKLHNVIQFVESCYWRVFVVYSDQSTTVNSLLMWCDLIENNVRYLRRNHGANLTDINILHVFDLQYWCKFDIELPALHKILIWLWENLLKCITKVFFHLKFWKNWREWWDNNILTHNAIIAKYNSVWKGS